MKRNLFIILMLFGILIVKAQVFDEIAYITIKVNGVVSTNNFYYYRGPDALIKDKLCLINHSFGNVFELNITEFNFCYDDVSPDNLLVTGSFYYYITDETNTIQYLPVTKIELEHSLIYSPEGLNPNGGDTYVYKDTIVTNIDLLSGLSFGNYNLHFWFEAHRSSPNEPPGNSIWVDVYNNSNPYIAHFTKTTITDNKEALNSKVSIFVKNNFISTTFEGNMKIDLYKITGEKVCSEQAKNHFIKQVEKGIYILKIDNKAFKVLV